MSNEEKILRNPITYLPVITIAMALVLGACAERAAPAADLRVLTLNLHTYQELDTAGVPESELTDELARQRIEAYGPIFDRIAHGISELDPDLICLQEVGEWPAGNHDKPGALKFGSSDSNMVHQILSRLPDRRYSYTADWSHLGWDVWLEGSAVLSKYPLNFTASRFVSSADTVPHSNDWKSRNVPMAKLEAPGLGEISVFSVHTGWWDDPDEPFQQQYRRLLEWVGDVSASSAVTILCGDFNVAAGSAGYEFMLEGSGFADQYALANPDGFLDATIGAGADGWEESDDGQRIDYILMNDDSPLEVARARRVFTSGEFGLVSDHVGVFVEFRLKKAGRP